MSWLAVGEPEEPGARSICRKSWRPVRIGRPDSDRLRLVVAVTSNTLDQRGYTDAGQARQTSGADAQEL
jgi:hypothetical protein